MIPNIFHFCYGFLPEPQFGFLEYLAIKSAHALNRPERIYLHYRYECSGPWWEKAAELVTPNRIEPPQEIFGRKLNHFAHRSDVVRLLMLQRHGGIYMDIDTLCLRPFAPLLDQRCVLARQGARGLCNAVILSEPDGQFVGAWLDSYRTFRSLGKDHFWDEHSVVIPGRLARESRLRDHVTILDSDAFFPFWDHPQRIFGSKDSRGFRRAYCLHYCESITRDEWLGRVSPETVATEETNFSRFARRAIEGNNALEDRETDDERRWTVPPRMARTWRGARRRVSGWFDWFVQALRWLLLQTRDVVWLPRLVRDLGWGPAASYVAQRLRLRAGWHTDAPFSLLASKHAAFPLRCRGGDHFSAFERVFILRPYECLDRAQNVDLIVDCGAGIGCASAYFLTRFPAARLIAVEPDPDNFSVLQANLAPYGERCRTLCAAVWPHAVPLVLDEAASSEGRQWRRRVRTARSDEVASLPGQDLATLLRESGKERISILRINIGGAETAVFGANPEAWLDRVDHLAVDVHGDASRSAVLGAIPANDFEVWESENFLCGRRRR